MRTLPVNMQAVVLVIHLLFALAIIAVVLLQRSEGGGLGVSTALGPQGGRPPVSGLAKVTWGLAVAFICTSLILTVLAARDSATTSVLDRIGVPAPPAPAPTPDLPLPPRGADAPLLPPRAD